MSLPSGLSEVIGGEEDIARFITSSSHVARTIKRIKHTAFKPAPDHDTSVFRVTGESDSNIHEMAIEHVKEKAKYGAALLHAKVVTEEAKLNLEAHEPPDKHANIRGWSLEEDPERRSAERKAKAMVLAEEAKLVEW